MFAWQRDAIGPTQESIALIAYDAAGMAEAVGSTFEAAAGIEPHTPLALPSQSTLTAATINSQPLSLRFMPATAPGAAESKADPALVAGAQKQVGPKRLVKFVAKLADGQAVAFWGGRLETWDASGALRAAHAFDQDVTTLTTTGNRILVGLADGRWFAQDTRSQSTPTPAATK
jgi:hypothetical protein